MDGIRVLVADDEKEIRELLKLYLEREAYRVDTAADGEEALRLFGQNTYNLVLLDLMMPKVDGMEVCRRMRMTSNLPILMLTAKDQEIDKIVGLGVGADDYITKPFSVHELVARIKAQLRRFLVLGSGTEGTGGTADRQRELIVFKELEIDLKQMRVRKQGAPIDLTAKEFELLKLFASHPQQVFTKTQLFRQVWSNDYLDDDNTVMVHIRRLRTKIEDNPSEPKLIQTVWGIGYRFAGERDEA
ncbi:DNA-binding response regulator, OmpR family, contains REC and winged-helix (wHTH) domain [Paenibacillus sp. UNCCL117]|uniref:response regulator transcription factor n=1 Tax=unclassified Paenibacillus TaxID=185978 RepID=UPI00088D8AE2|nr:MULTISPECIES: response regulator transcription factor [unclassified Paenibacillus]SDE62107.1 DNA-binding response regulator, OmpR family, contains REC and winged-helix (wHTH) domain [Paenibacillus sp. cl123]SFW69882.1 DNA-binding response regulator, OmpR family, contains REC and winged-helix (wHTH) domain [Paenibacillus sp. UNCCL117]